MLPRPSWPRAVQSGLWQNWVCGSIGVPHEAWFGDHAWRNAGWTRVFQAPTPKSRFNGVLPVASAAAGFQAGDRPLQPAGARRFVAPQPRQLGRRLAVETRGNDLALAGV